MFISLLSTVWADVTRNIATSPSPPRCTPPMRVFLITGLFLLVSCGSKPGDTTLDFERHIPDTTKSWAGRMTKECYEETKRLEAKLGLHTLSDGTNTTEIRVWNFSGSYDPQVLFLLKNGSTKGWQLRTVSFYKTKGDSIYADYSRIIRQKAVDSLDLNRYWTLASQSDLKAGDTYGCMDGGDVLVELASPTKYRFMWYRCPDIHKEKDSVFLLANQLTNGLDALAVEH
jgi:hypothetical protein